MGDGNGTGDGTGTGYGALIAVVVVLVVVIVAWPVVAAVASFVFTGLIFGGIPGLVLLLSTRLITRVLRFIDSYREKKANGDGR